MVQVRTNAAHNMCGHTFYVMDACGAAPQRSTVEAACAHLGGHLMEPSSDQAPLSSSGTISFSFLGQQWSSSWGGSAGKLLTCTLVLYNHCSPSCLQHCCPAGERRPKDACRVPAENPRPKVCTDSARAALCACRVPRLWSLFWFRMKSNDLQRLLAAMRASSTHTAHRLHSMTRV